MAERRMFAKTIVDSDAFLDMPLSSQALYFHLSLRADDDGFLNNAKKIMRTIGANQNDYDMLLAKRFIIQFEDGICVIKHWRIHNYIQKDRYKPTVYQEQLRRLGIKENKSYTLNKKQETILIDLEEDNIENGESNVKKSKDYPSIKQQIDEYTEDLEMKEALNQFVLMREKIRKKLTNYAFYRLLNKLSKLSTNKDTQIEILNRSIDNSWNDIYPLENKNKTFKPNNKKDAPIPDWYDKYKTKLKETSKEPRQKMSKEEIEKILTEAKESGM